MRITLILLIFILLSGCSQVKPWQRGILAKDNMQGGPLEQKLVRDQHILFSKEGASGGGRAAGGGCGCN